jgi:hypothetical protein
MDVIWSGGTTEEALSAWRESMQDSGFDVGASTAMHNINFDDLHTEKVAKNMLKNYVDRYSNFLRQIELIAIEQPFAVPLSPDPSDKTSYVGSIDKVYRKQNHIIFVDHKTTKAYKKDGPFRADYLESFSPDAQMEGYMYAGALTYQDNFRGMRIDNALVHKTVHNGFRMLPLEKSFELLDQWLIETQQYISNLIDEYNDLFKHWDHWKKNSVLPLFLRRTEECNHYAGCTYKNICKFNPNPLKLDVDDPPEGFEVSRWSPFDEIALNKLQLTPGEDD